MCKKLFAVLLVLGLVSSAMAVSPDDLLIYYTMDAEDSVDGYQLNNAEGCARIGSAGDGNECFYSSDGVDYGPGLFGDALYISNDGTGLPFDDPNSWSTIQPEMGDFIDIEEAAEQALWPFENVTVSMWFNQTAPLIWENHISQWQSQTHAIAHVFGTHWSYYGMIKITQDVDNPGVEPDYLSFKLGGNVEGSGYFDTGPGYGSPCRNKEVPITLNEWYHVAYSLGEEEPNGMVLASAYVNGALLHSEMVNSFTTKQPTLTDMPGLVVGAYHEINIPDYFVMIPDGMLIDDFAIFGVAAGSDAINDIYGIGLQGIPLSSLFWWWSLGPADFVCPRGIDMADFSFFAGYWMRDNCGPANGYCAETDLDMDGDVDFNDLKWLAECWLEGV